MVTFAQAQERAERWVNADVPGHQHRDVRVREFGLGFVAWSEERGGGASPPDGSWGDTASDGGRARLVIARDSGEVTLWPGLPVDEVIRCYEQQYGSSAAADAARDAAAPPQRLDLEATSFLLTPPDWLQDAADQLGIPDRRSSAGGPGTGAGTPAAAGAAPGGAGATGGGPGAWPDAGAGAGRDPGPAGTGSNPWDAADTSSSDGGTAQRPPATVFAPPLSGSDEEDTLPPGDSRSEARTALLPEGSGLPRTAVAPALGEPGSHDEPGGHASAAYGYPQQGTPAPPGAPDDTGSGGGVHHAATMLADPSHGGPGTGTPPPPGAPGTPGAGDIADADTSRAPRGTAPPRQSRASRGSGPSVPPPPGAPGTPGAGSRPGQSGSAGPGTPGTPGGGYVPTQLVSSDDVASMGGDTPGGDSASGSGSGGDSGGGVHHAATMLADPSHGGPGTGTPPPPGAPGTPGAGGTPPPGGTGGGVHAAATMLAGGPAPGGPGAPPPPGAPPGAPGPPQPPGSAPPAYGYPQPPGGLPTVGPGYMAVLRYRAPDGSEQQLIRRSAPGTPHPEWQILHELRGMNVPPQQVLELHTELESCDLPGGYCARMIRETWPQVRVSHTAAYGHDHASRQQGMRHLIEHQGELHQVADAPPRPAPNRVPLPPPQQIQPAPPIPPDGIGHELFQAFGPQGVFRFDQRAVSRQGVPDIVGQLLVWAGVPVDLGPFFWGQAQPGRPVPTLAELAQERGMQPAPDAGSYLVMGNDFGRQICVQYGTAHIVAVPLEAGPGGQPAAPQFVSTGLPEFIRSLALLGRMWRLRFGLTPEQAGRWTVDFQTQLSMLDPAALSSPENWWSVLVEQMWDGLI